ncbi:MAG TPA: prepilin peptidase [Sphingobium sp.]|uniref:A24 family peptidase n=1 Tax=Sphingobium sp. TaxID=1912891 RepID=UPI002ED5F632
MHPDFLPSALLILLAALLIRAAVTDLRARIISNRLNAAIALLAPLYWWSMGLTPWPEMAIQLALCAAVFTVFVTLFALGAMGGGDVKMLAALALWLPGGALISLLVLMALLGGVVTVVTVVHHRWTRRIGAIEIPYGVAIALAGLWVIGEPYFNPFA